MSGNYSPWSDIKAEGRAADPRTEDEKTVGKAAARERREAEVRGHQLAEMRTTAGITQAQLAKALGVSQVRISKIEHGEVRLEVDPPQWCSQSVTETSRSTCG